jgi:hypothetical protein
MTSKPVFQADIEALGKVLDALSKLEPAAQQWVLSTAATRLNVSTIAIAPPSGGTPVSHRTATPPSGSIGSLHPKEFMRQKAPQSDVDRVACLAYYLTHGRQASAYSSRELTAMNTEAAGPKLNMSRAVDNATKQSGYLTSAGKGKKQITSYGEDVVNALPDYEAVKTLATTRTAKPRKKKARRKAA